MEMESGQDNMVPLILNTGDSHQQQSNQLSPTSPPLSLSQVQPHTLVLLTLFMQALITVSLLAEGLAHIKVNAIHLKLWNFLPYQSPSFLQAAINAMNLEQQLSQYAFFSQQQTPQTLQNQQVR